MACVPKLLRPQDLEETEHFRRWRQEKVAKIVQCGVEGVEAFYEQCVANGVTIIEPITATEWGTKDFYVKDPDGYIISFGGRPVTGSSSSSPLDARSP